MADSPSYYTRGEIEVWDFIRDQDLNYHLGAALKYICRAGYKNAETKAGDLKKAINYIENELQHTPTPPTEYEPFRHGSAVPYRLRRAEWGESSRDATGSNS